MSRKLRLALASAAAAALATLALTGSATAAYVPRLAVSASAAVTTFNVQMRADHDPTAALYIYAPSTVQATFTASPGTPIGTVNARAAAADLGGAELPLTGTLEVRAATGTYLSSGTPVPLATAAKLCTGTEAHTAFWVLILSAGGQRLEVPMFVDAIPAGHPAAAFASALIVVCLPPPDLPAGTPGRAAFGAKLLEAIFTVRGVFTAPAGEHRWRMLAIPYVPARGVVNLAARVEVQSLVRLPTAATLAAKAKPGSGKAVVSGVVTENGKPVAGATVLIISGTKVVGRAKTNAAGRFTKTMSLPKGKLSKLRGQATAPVRELGSAACTPAGEGVPCPSATVGGFTVFTKTVAVRA